MLNLISLRASFFCFLTISSVLCISTVLSMASCNIAGDVDDNGEIGLSDTIASLQVIINTILSPVSLGADVNGDGQIGMAETVYTLQYLSGQISSDNEIYVPGDFPTIQQAINAAQDGNTIVVADGIYNGNILFNTGNDTLCLRSQNGPGLTTIQGDGTDSAIVFPANNNSTLQGFTVTGGSATNGGGILCGTGSAPVIDNCIIDGNSASIGGGGVHCACSCSAQISSCIIKNNQTTGGTVESNGGGIHISLNGTPSIINSIFYDNISSYNGGALAAKEAAPTIINCTFSENGAANRGGALSFFSPGAGTYVVNSIIWDNETDTELAEEIAVGGGSLTTVSYCDIKGDDLYPGTGNMNEDPLFVGDDDLHLQNSSSCINQGTATHAIVQIPSSDIDGDGRPLGSGIDIGADEVQ